jgi:hypothetical protein
MAEPRVTRRRAAAVAGAVAVLGLAGAERASDGGPLVAGATTTETTDTEPPASAGGDGDGGSPTDGFYLVEAVDAPPCRPPDRPDRADEACYALADERAFGIDGVASAVATRPRNGPWLVALTLTDDGVAALNRAASICFERSPPCFERDDITVVTGDEAAARSLADTLTG